MSNTEPGFTVIDKRGTNRAEETAVVIEPDAPKTGKRSWKGAVEYPSIPKPTPTGMLMAVQAVGLRDDGSLFTADYILPPILPKNFDWKSVVTKRIDSYLACDCSREIGTCGMHQQYERQWMEQDAQRLNMFASQPVPECIEVMVNLQRQKQPKVVLAKGPLPPKK